jgi:allantoin racemase
MRILLLNPNTTATITDRLYQAAIEATAPGTVLVPMTAPRGVPYIATRAEAQIGGAIALEMLAEEHRNVDAAIIAAFGDPGLLAAPWYRECVEMHGLTGRCAGIRMLDSAFQSISDVQDEKEDLLIELAKCAVSELDADVVILAGAPLAGLAKKVKSRIPVPVVDQVQAAVKLAEAVLALGTNKATAGTFRRPAAKPTIGVPLALQRRIEHTD